MGFVQHRRDWEDLAQIDPMWAILSDPSKRAGQWDVNEFFATGMKEAEEVRDLALRLGFSGTFESALDFGCGLGRVTRGLRRFCNECIGVDISAEMIQGARSLSPDCKFVLTSEEDLRNFANDRFDLVYSRRVLQHQPSEKAIVRYVEELIRVLRPGGLAEFQIPATIPLYHRIQPRRRVYEVLRSAGVPPVYLYRIGLVPIRMSAAHPESVTRAVERSGGRIVLIEPDQSAPLHSHTYCATK